MSAPRRHRLRVLTVAIALVAAMFGAAGPAAASGVSWTSSGVSWT